MNARHRRGALALAAVATLAAAAWVSESENSADALVLPAKEAGVKAPREELHAAPPAAQSPPDLRRAPFPDAPADPFAARTWNPRVAEKPPAPTAPAVPYTYFGRMTEDGKVYVFLQRGERTYTVASGSVLDTQYRVEEITPAAVVITYLPLMQRQVLHTGSQQP